MRKYITCVQTSFFVLCMLSSSLLRAQSPSSSNTLGSSGVTSIASTTDPAFQLSVNGTTKLYGTGNGTGSAATMVTSPSLFLQNTTSSTGRQYLINSDDAGNFKIADAVGTTTFTATDRFVINSTGLIGIGNSSPSARLHITGTGATSSSNSLLIQNSSSANLFTVRDDGKVGIGTASPTEILDVAGNVKITGTNSSPILVLNNHYQNPQITTVNTYNANGAATGFAAVNNLNHGLQMTMASSGNVFIPDAAWIRSDGAGGLSLVVNGGGPIAFTPSLTLGSSSEWGRFSSAGYFGLGERSPTEKLDVVGNIKFTGALMPANSAGTSGQVLTSAGSGSAPTWATPGTGYWTATGSNISNNNAGNVGIGTTSPQYLLDVNGSGRIIGNLIIGNDTYTFPSGYRMSVKDGIITERLKIRLRANWPDYVFDGNYKLPGLAEIENYILLNKHLPDIQSAETIKTDGVELGEMTTVLLKKIEELTLYVIKTDKEIQSLKKRLSTIEVEE